MTLYWVGNAGNWDDTTHWSASSGGAGSAGVPTSSDDVVFDANSITLSGQTVTVRSGHTNACNNLTMTNVVNSPTIALAASATLGTYGDITIPSGVTFTRGASALWNLNGTGIMNWNVAANLSNISLRPNSTGTLKLQANLTLGQLFNAGNAYTFTLNGFNLNVSAWTEQAASTINCGSGTMQIVVGTGSFTPQLVIGNAAPPNVTWNRGTSLLKISASSGSNTIQVLQSGISFYNVEFATGSVNPNFNINNTVSMNNLTFDAGVTVKFTSTQTYTVNGTITSTATSLSHASIISSSAGSRFILSSPTNSVAVTYVDVKDCNATGITPFTTQGGFDNGNNINWTFVPDPLFGIPTFNYNDPNNPSVTISGMLNSTSGVAGFGLVYDNNNQFPTVDNYSVALPVSTNPFSQTITGLIPGETYYFGEYILSNSGLISYYNYQSYTVNAAIKKKRYLYKVYDTSLRYVKTWSNDVVSDPTFRMVINGGAGELIVKLARTYTSFGEGSDVTLNNRVELWCFDRDTPQGSRIFTGYISAYSPTIDGQDQYLTVTLLGYATRLAAHILRDHTSGQTQITYAGFDPSAILKDAIDKYHDDGGTDVFYTPVSIANTNSVVSYPFNNNTIQEVIDKVIELTPENWYWYVDANGIVYLQPSNIALATHQVTIGRDLSQLSSNKRIESMVNAVTVIGGGSPNLYNYYERAASIAQYGKFERRIQDGRVTVDTTSDFLAQRMLDRFDTPEYRTTIRIIDNNGDNQSQGDNIESYQPGDSIQVINLPQAPILIIQSITYTPNYIDIEASTRLPEVPKRIEDIERNLTTQFQLNLPTTPTVRSV